jgi:hypothetical protein
MAQQPQDYALVIGINDYPNYRPLQGAIQDAQKFAEWLTDEQAGGGLEGEHCHTVMSRLNPLGPGLDEIGDVLDAIRRQAEQSGGRRFYFYFAGHGHTGEIEEVHLCLARWSSQNAGRAALSASKCYSFVAECLGFKEIVVLLDCCRVRVVGAAGLPPYNSCIRPREQAGQVRLFRAYATEFLNLAREAAVNETAPLEAEGPVIQGYFTQALLTALRGAAAEPGGGVKPSKLKEYLEREVFRLAESRGHKQQARVSANELPDEPESFFGSAPPLVAANIEIRFQPGRRGEVRLIGPDLAEIKKGQASSGPWQLSLSQGIYLLSGTDPFGEMHIPFQPKTEVTYVEF